MSSRKVRKEAKRQLEIEKEKERIQKQMDYLNTEEGRKAHKKISRIVGIIMIILVISIGGCTISSVSKKAAEKKAHDEALAAVEVYFDPMEYQSLSEEELVSKKGEPTSIEDWTYTKADNTQFPVKTYYYDNEAYDYVSKTDGTTELVTIRLDYVGIDDPEDLDIVRALFNDSEQHTDTEVTKTSGAYRIKKATYYDLWIILDDNKLTSVNINFFENVW